MEMFTVTDKPVLLYFKTPIFDKIQLKQISSKVPDFLVNNTQKTQKTCPHFLRYLEYLIGRKKVGIKFRWFKKSSLKNLVTGKMIRYFLPTNFFAWQYENINWIKKTISYLDHSYCLVLKVLIDFKVEKIYFQKYLKNYKSWTQFVNSYQLLVIYKKSETYDYVCLSWRTYKGGGFFLIQIAIMFIVKIWRHPSFSLFYQVRWK